MFEFKVSEELQPNTEILELIENYTFVMKKNRTPNKI